MYSLKDFPGLCTPKERFYMYFLNYPLHRNGVIEEPTQGNTRELFQDDPHYCEIHTSCREILGGWVEGATRAGFYLHKEVEVLLQFKRATPRFINLTLDEANNLARRLEYTLQLPLARIQDGLIYVPSLRSYSDVRSKISFLALLVESEPILEIFLDDYGKKPRNQIFKDLCGVRDEFFRLNADPASYIKWLYVNSQASYFGSGPSSLVSYLEEANMHMERFDLMIKEQS